MALFDEIWGGAYIRGVGGKQPTQGQHFARDPRGAPRLRHMPAPPPPSHTPASAWPGGRQLPPTRAAAPLIPAATRSGGRLGATCGSLWPRVGEQPPASPLRHLRKTARNSRVLRCAAPRTCARVRTARAGLGSGVRAAAHRLGGRGRSSRSSRPKSAMSLAQMMIMSSTCTSTSKVSSSTR